MADEYGLLSDPWLNMGIGLLAKSINQPRPVNIGEALLGGMSQAGNALDMQQKMKDAKAKEQDRAMQMQMHAATLAEAQRKAAKLQQIEQSIGNMPHDVQQAYMFGGPEKAFEYLQQKQFMSGAEGLLNPKQPVSEPTPPPRPYQDTPNGVVNDSPISGNFQVTPGLQASVEKLKTTNPSEYQNVVTALKEQGLVGKEPAAPVGPDWGKVAEYSMRGSLAGVKGANGMMELAKFNKPEIQFLDLGNSMVPVNKNNPTQQTYTKGMTPELAWNMQKFGMEQKESEGSKLNTNTTELRKEFSGLQPVKDWHTIVPVLQTAREAAKVDNKAADLNMIYALAKLYDPGSVVRESETEMQIKSGSPAEQFQGYWNQVTGGGRLPPEVRKKMMEQVEIRAKSYHDSYSQFANQYSDLAQRKGISPQDVILKTSPYEPPKTDQPNKQGSNKFDILPAASQYKGKSMKADNGTIYYSDGNKWIKR